MHARSMIAAVALWLAAAGVAQARELFVDQKHAEADDRNPGTESKPFKTIQPAIDAARLGDTIYVKAGLYSDRILLRGFGRPGHPITLTAWRDDRVAIGSELRDLPPAAQWKPVGGHKSFEVQMPEGTPEDIIVIVDGKPMVTQPKDAPPADDLLYWATYRRADRTLMVNIGGGNPAAIHRLQFARRCELFIVTDQAAFWQIKKLEFAWCNTGIAMDGTGILIEDCFFHDIYRPAIFGTGRLGTIRRCNFYRCGAGVSGTHGAAGIIEDCLFIACGLEAHEDIDSRVNNDGETSTPLSFKRGPIVGGIVRYCTIADSTGCLWWDCGGTGLRIIGNAFWSNRWGNGIYNEYGINDTLAIGNYFFRTAMSSSWSTRMTVADNFFDNVRGGGVQWHNRDPWPLRYGFMTVRGNAFTGIHRGYLGGADRGTDGLWPDGFARAFVDFNRARIRPDDYVLIWGKSVQMKALAEIQQKYGWELHGEVKSWDEKANDLTPAAMGGSTVTFRVPWGPRSHLARPMLSDAAIDGRWPAAAEYAGGRFPAFFWRVADGNCDEKPLNARYFDATTDTLWRPMCSAGYDLGVNRGASWYVGAEDKYLDPKLTVAKPPDRAEFSSGNRWLVVAGVKPEEMPPAGTGWWTPWMATAPGARITVSFRMYGKGIEATDKATPAVYMQFISATGQQMTRAFLVGRDGHSRISKPNRQNLTQGTYDWTAVKETLTAPEAAIRMALFLGLQPCKGEVGFDDIHIDTEDGPLPKEEAEIAEALPPRVAKERFRDILYIDISKQANRALADDKAGDSSGGWTDQGPDLDLRNLKAGEQSFGGVPFRIIGSGYSRKTAIAVKGNGKAGTALPQEVTVPVGRPIEALYILHAGAFLGTDRTPYYQFVVKYRDGATTWWGPAANIRPDWLAPAVRTFPEDWGAAQTTAALTVPVGPFANNRRATLYRTEWIFDRARHAVPVESVTIRGTDNGVGLVVGLTGVTQW